MPNEILKCLEGGARNIFTYEEYHLLKMTQVNSKIKVDREKATLTTFQ